MYIYMRKIAYMSSWKSSKEGDQHLKFWYDEMFLPYNDLKLLLYITFYHCTWWIPCWLSNVFLCKIQYCNNSFFFWEKSIIRKWGSKRGRFPFLGTEVYVLRREIGSKRGSLPPEEETWHVWICKIENIMTTVYTRQMGLIQMNAKSL